MRKSILSLVVLVIANFTCMAITVEQAKDLYNRGEYKQAVTELQKQLTKTPSSASLNLWMGACLYEEGKFEEAKKYLKIAESKGQHDAYFYLSLIAYDNYELKEAVKYLDLYKNAIAKAKKTMTPNIAKNIEALNRAKTMLDHVENIEVVDSIIVAKDDFFKAYKISPEIGSLNDKSNLSNISSNAINPVFIPESKQRMLWSAIDDNGKFKLMETTKLIDDSWDVPHLLKGKWNEADDTAYPYLMPDGTTLYFAAKGEESIGGYDIFITRKDTETGEYLQPQNLGMPYNSPSDDYMLVIDEFTGAGWWATDRNRIPDKLTIYIFKPSEVRKNYNIDDPNITSLAQLKSIKDTWVSGEDYSSFIEKINNIKSNKVQVKKDFDFILKNGKHYTTVKDFKSQEARNLIIKWEKEIEDINLKSEQLSSLRKKYISNKSDNNLSSQILRLEHEIETLRLSAYDTANAIRRAELNN